MTRAEIQTLLTDSGCIESCLSTKTLLSVIVHLLFEAGGIPEPVESGSRILSEEGDTLITEEGDQLVTE